MEALSRKAEEEKLVELDAMLADATLTGDMSDDTSSEILSPIQPSYKTCSAASPTGSNPRKSSQLYNSKENVAGRTTNEVTDETFRIFYSSSCNEGDSSEDDMDILMRQEVKEAKRRRRLVRGDTQQTFNDQRREERDELSALKLQLAMAESQLNQKDVVVKSLQRQVNQREMVDGSTKAKAEEELVAASAKASGLQEELTRTSQLLMDGALVRKELEQRCTSLAGDLEKATNRAGELEVEVKDTHAELVRVTGALYARRGMDVEDVEKMFAEELERVREVSSHEARELQQSVNDLRTSLEETRGKCRIAYGERDALRTEVGELSGEVSNLQEIVRALKQLDDGDTINQLLDQIVHWRDRARDLEELQKSSLSPSPASFESVTCTEASETLSALFKEETEEFMSNVKDSQQEDVLRQELREAQETLLMAGEEVAMAIQIKKQESIRACTAETRAQTLQLELEAGARAAKEGAIARRAAKRKMLENLKNTIRQEMSAEIYRLRSEIEEQRSFGESDKICPKCRCSGGSQSAGVLASCTVDDIDAVVSTSNTPNSAEEEKKARAHAAVVEQLTERITSIAPDGKDEARAWASAFTSATQFTRRAFVSLRRYASEILSSDEGVHAMVFSTVREEGELDESSMLPLANRARPQRDAENEAMEAMKIWQHAVDSSVEAIRSALAAHVRRMELLQRGQTETIQIPEIFRTTTGSQTEEAHVAGQQNINPGNELQMTQHPGDDVQPVEFGEENFNPRSGVIIGAPAWDRVGVEHVSVGNASRRNHSGHARGEKRDLVTLKLRKETMALRAALERVEQEKSELVTSLTRDYERTKVVELDKQRSLFESQIQALNEYTMAIIEEFGAGKSRTMSKTRKARMTRGRESRAGSD